MLAQFELLTPEIAVAFCAAPKSVDLLKFSRIDPASVEVLLRSSSALHLTGLNNIQDEILKQLRTHTEGLLVTKTELTDSPGDVALARLWYGKYEGSEAIDVDNGSLKLSGLGSNSQAKEAMKVGFNYFKANATHVSASIKSLDHDYHLRVVELHNTGPTAAMTLTTFIALCSAVLGKPIQSQMFVLVSMSLGGNFIPVESLGVTDDYTGPSRVL